MSVPFFKDFNKKTKDYYQKREYDFGQTIELNQKVSCNGGECGTVKAKLENGKALKSKFTFVLKRPWGSIDIVEDMRKGLSLKLKMPKFYKSFDLISEHSNSMVQVETKYNPSASYWNAKLIGLYNSGVKGAQRCCTTTLSFAVGDDSLNLSVGGKIQIQNKLGAGQNKEAPASRVSAPSISNYSLGFLYTPSKESAYSVIYSPDKQSNGLEYSFGLWRKLNDSLSLSAKADGKVDTKLTGFPPVLSVGGGWNVSGGNYLQGFVNSRNEWGLAYRVKVNDAMKVHMGIASFIDISNNRVSSKLGWKLHF